MKCILKKSLTILLTLLMLLPAASLVVPASAANGMSIPTVYVYGRTEWIYLNYGKADQKIVWDGSVPVPDGYIEEKTKEILPLLAKAVTSGDYEEYCTALVDAVSAVYTDFKLGNDGMPENGSTIANKWNPAGIRNTRHGDGLYYLDDYAFIYDWRLDPCEIADDLNNYINRILAVTGCKKVNLVGRCMGGTVEMAYLAKYGTEKIATCTFLCSTMNGCALASDCFAGQVDLNSKAIDRYVNERMGLKYDGLATDVITDELLIDFIKSGVSMLNSTYALPLAAGALEMLYDKIETDVLPDIVLNSYGTLPSFWSMVDQNDYEQAKELIFNGRTEEYGKLIEKIDNYHYNVQAKIPELLKKFKEEDGVPVTILAKYGFQLMPLIASADKLNDDMIELDSASLGATCSNVTDTLDDDYILRAQLAGKGKYISPDNQVDASTCLFPDNTWFIKNSYHGDFYADIAAFIWTELQAGGNMTVDSNPRFPQYMLYIEESNTVVPLTEDNCETRDWPAGFFTSIVRFFRSVYALLSRYFDSVFNKQAVTVTA